MTPMAGKDRSQGLSDQLAAMFDAVVAAESVPLFLAVLEDVVRHQGLELVVLGAAADGAPVEAAAAALDHGELTLEPEPRVSGSDRQGAVVLGHAAAAGRPDGELVLRRAGGAEPTLPVVEMAAHVLRALRLHRALVGGQLRGQATTIVLDAIPFGVILVNASARVLQANRLGDEILRLADGLAADRSGLSTSTRADTDRLRNVIAQVAAATAAANATPVGVLRLERPSPPTRSPRSRRCS
jgi:PAS domain-containing protein